MPGYLTAKELREQRMSLHTAQSAMLEKAKSESRSSLSSEETVEWDRRDAEIADLTKQIERIEAHETREREMSESRGVIVGINGMAPNAKIDPEQKANEQRSAFEKWFRFGKDALNAEERATLAELRAQSVGTTTAGGFLIPQGFSGQIEQSLLAFGGMREAATSFSTASGNDLPWPTVDDTAQTGTLLAENTAVANQDVTFGQITFKAYKYSSKQVLVSEELLQDSAFDLGPFLAEVLATRIGRILNTHFTTGDNTSKPQGVVTASSVGKTGATGQTTSVVYNDLVDLVHSIDPAYRAGPKVGWMMHDSSLKVIKKLVDSQNRPLWMPGLAVKEPDTILGFKYVINQDVAQMAANAKSILFGDFSKYRIRDVRGITLLRLNERYADAHQVGFLAFSRHDGRMLDAGTDPVKHYANSAT